MLLSAQHSSSGAVPKPRYITDIDPIAARFEGTECMSTLSISISPTVKGAMLTSGLFLV